MNMGISDIVPWLESFSKLSITPNVNKQIIICPSLPHLSLLKEVGPQMGFVVGAQNVSDLEKGAHTGEVGFFQLKELVNYCIVGHSERKEKMETVINKRNLCIMSDITPIVCFVNPEDSMKLDTKGVILCWEDPNNISVNGVYREKDTADIYDGIKAIKSKISQETELIYGGSVNRENIQALSKIDEINGVLVGNASLDPQHFVDIINSSI